MYLEPKNRRKSFNGKAIETDGTLISYGSTVAKLVNGEPKLVKGLWDYSNTTVSHVRAWLETHGFAAGAKQEISKKYEIIEA